MTEHDEVDDPPFVRLLDQAVEELGPRARRVGEHVDHVVPTTRLQLRLQVLERLGELVDHRRDGVVQPVRCPVGQVLDTSSGVLLRRMRAFCPAVGGGAVPPPSAVVSSTISRITRMPSGRYSRIPDGMRISSVRSIPNLLRWRVRNDVRTGCA
jgi:hypothetical protein